MSTEILQPFQLDTNGSIATTTSAVIQTNQHLESLASTNPGERVMIPTYGIATGRMLFAMNSSANQQSWLNEAQNAIARWEPSVQIESINIQSDATVNDPERSDFRLDINWIPSSNQAGQSLGVQKCTVLVGGTVIQDAVT